ncbi:4-hydroxythreonine-4-phosphate dehydrogenase PdxA [soil metagenome]
MKEKIAITLGDPTGIGPEVVAAAIAAAGELVPRIVVYGDRDPLERGAASMKVTLPADLALVQHSGGTFLPGKPDATSGAAQVAYLEAAIAAAIKGDVGAIVTAPISKTWAKKAGFAFPGHTELLAARFKASEAVMFFAGPRMKVALVTVHIPHKDVAAALTTDRIKRVVELVAESLRRDFGLARPRIGVLGLNPHAGENKLLGTEDADIIAPALGALAIEGSWHGPLIPDAAFRDALDGKYDALVAMYHDQGLIPVKLIDFEESVNITLGLPIVRTSPDHGTAYDIAGTGKARAVSTQRALSLAAEMLARR